MSTRPFGKSTLLASLIMSVFVTLGVNAASSWAWPAAPTQSSGPQAFGEFVAFCPFSHRAPDDPIVHPNHAGMSHSHEFMGNVSTAATTTVESLAGNATNCDPAVDRSAYWVPTLYGANGDPIAIEHATFYYFSGVNNPSELQALPFGLKIIAGQANATTPPNPARFKWSCLGAPDSSTTAFVVCPVGSKLEMLLNFPDCWDGKNLDSADHKSHMSYNVNGACPITHPVAVPQLQFKLRYATRGEAGMSLASGAAYTMHGDFFNAWEEAAFQNRLACLQQGVKCGPEGFPDDQPAATATAVPPAAPTATATATATATPIPTATAINLPGAAPTTALYAPLIQR